MGTELIAAMLKKARNAAHRSVKETVDFLEQFGVSVSPKTIYGWEAARSQPDIDTFLLLCKCYDVKPETFINLSVDVISNHDKSADPLSSDALCVAHCYDKAEQKEKDTVRLVLGMTEVVDSPRTDDEQEKELA